MTTTSGSAKWQGGIKDGKGRISTQSGALKDNPYGFNTRFEDQPGTYLLTGGDVTAGEQMTLDPHGVRLIATGPQK